MVSIDYDTVTREIIIQKRDGEMRLKPEEAKEIALAINLVEDRL